MAPVRRSEPKTSVHSSKGRFEVMTIEDWPGELIITQIDANDPNGVRAMATIGLYRDRAERAKRLVAAFHERLRALGKVARFDD